MPYVVRWVPRGPGMAARCHTAAEVLELTRELNSRGYDPDLRITFNDQDVSIDALRSGETIEGDASDGPSDF